MKEHLLTISLIWLTLLISGCTKPCICDNDDPPKNVEISESDRGITLYDGKVMDYDSNLYDIDTFDNRIWFLSNLRTSHYNDGEPILYPGDDDYTWMTTNEGAYSMFKHSKENGDIFGYHYNWYAVTSNKLCPDGFHVSTDDDWKNLLAFIGIHDEDMDAYGYKGNNSEPGKLKGLSSLWNEPNVDATDEIGFNALPGEFRYWNGQYHNAQYDFLQTAAFWTTDVDTIEDLGIYYSLNTGLGSILKYRHSKSTGFSVRCVKQIE